MKLALKKIYAGALYSALEDKKSDQTDVVILNFLKILRKKGLLDRLNKILDEFKKLYNQKNGIIALKVASIAPLEEDTIKKIAESLEIKNYEAEMIVDKKLLGGVAVRYDDNLLDMTLKNYLNKLTKHLSS